MSNDSVEKIVAEMRGVVGVVSSHDVIWWADRLAALAPAGVGEGLVRGPWHAGKDGKDVFSDDFALDVALRISGDFESDEQALAYANELAAKLNARPDSVSEAADAARYRWLIKATPYRFGKVQQAATIDAGDVLYFDKDKFDTAIDAALEAARAAALHPEGQ